MLTVLIVQRFFLYLTSLITGLHGSEYTASICNAVELRKYSLLYQVSQFLDHKTALTGVFIFCQAPFPVNDHLYRQCPTNRVFAGRGHCLIIGIGVQTVAVIVNGNQRLQCCTDVVETHLLCMKRAA